MTEMDINTMIDEAKDQKDFDNILKSLKQSSIKSRFIESSSRDIWKLSSGFDQVDKSLGGGFREGSCYIVGGLRKSGKSSLLMTLANSFLLSGQTVGFADTELSERDFVNRMAAINNNKLFSVIESDSSYGIDWLTANEKKFERCSKNELLQNGELSSDLVINIFDQWYLLGTRIFILDNLTSFNQGSNKDSQGWQRIGECLQKVIDWTNSKGAICFLVLHTHDSLDLTENIEKLKRIIENDTPKEIFEKSVHINRRPSTSDLFGSKSALSQLTGGVLLLWRPFQDFREPSWQGYSLLIIEGIRGSGSSEHLIWFDGSKYKFSVIANPSEVPFIGDDAYSVE